MVCVLCLSHIYNNACTTTQSLERITDLGDEKAFSGSQKQETPMEE